MVLLKGKNDDWTFIDWADLDKTGAVCAEQMLMAKAYHALTEISKALGYEYFDYQKKYADMRERINKFYWNEEKGGFIDSYQSGRSIINRQANIFAMMYGIANVRQSQSIVENVLENDEVPAITTPYFKGYELDVFGMAGKFSEIEKMLNSYWGAMADSGATTVWEEFNPELCGISHYEMYGHKYGKSLCHAWGASPVYLFGRYYLGVYPTLPGYETFCVEPNLGGLEFIKGKVPVNEGCVSVFLNKNKLEVISDKAGGTLIWKNKTYKIEKNIPIIIENITV